MYLKHVCSCLVSYYYIAATEVETNVGGVSERATIMSEEGFEALCKDVGIDPYADAFALQILHAMAAEDPSNISFDQFRRGMVSMQASNAAELKSRRAKLEADVRSDRKTFLRFWAHAFVANREPGMKVVSVDVVKGLLAMLSPDWALLVEFEAFLDTKKVVSLDTWKQLLRFQREVKPDLSGYEDDMSWPTTIDEFVVFVNKRRGGAGADAGAAAGGGGK